MTSVVHSHSEKVTLRVRLPRGREPEPIELENDIEVTQAIRKICRKFSEKLNQYDQNDLKLVVSPSPTLPGRVLLPNEILNTTHINWKEEILELFVKPICIQMIVSDGSSVLNTAKVRQLFVEEYRPLCQMVPIFQRVFKLPKEDYAFQAVQLHGESQGVEWYNSNKTLFDCHFEKSTLLVLYPISLLYKDFRFGTFIINPEKEGWLIKEGGSSNPKFGGASLSSKVKKKKKIFCTKRSSFVLFQR